MEIRPSGASTWAACSGYPAMVARYPEIPEESDDDVREDGIAAHWLAHQIYTAEMPELNSLSPNGRTLDEDMFDGVDMYLDHIRSWPEPQNTHIEESVDCSIILRGMKGTPDAWNWNPATRVLRVSDFKYGFKFVEVWFNLQLIIYALSILEKLGMTGMDDQQIVVEFSIVQPRSFHRDGHIRIWRVLASDLRAEANFLRDRAHAASLPNASCTPNDMCGDCPGRHACMAFQNAALHALEVSYDSVPLELSPAALGNERRIIKQAMKRLEGRLSGIEGQIESLINSGVVVPHATMSPHYHREGWKPGVKADVLNLGKYYDTDVAKPREPISPARARKVLPHDIVAMYAHKPLGGYKVTTTDPLEAVKKFTKQP